ncbi:PVC-type heme-binding CxxCH protein [Verrucomicrobiota bacterium sgz303538]
MRTFLPLIALFATAAIAAEPDANRLTYLDSDDPFYPQLGLARLTTPQWIGEDGVEAAVIISIDDLRETKKYETYLRPVLERLKKIDGRAPVSIFCNQLPPEDPQFQAWLGEGVSLEVHTLTHPCPFLGKDGSFAAAEQTYHGGVDLLARIPGNQPLAFRMPCCDSMNSASPRFFSEIFARRSPEGRFLAVDSSVMCLFTSRDSALPRELTTDSSGGERFRKYFPMELVPPRKLTFERFAGFIENYPYPYVIGHGCWEFPAVVPSDWEAFNTHGSKNPRTTEDWKAALDATVLKQGVMTMILHPHGWSDPQQIVDLNDHATAKYGKRVKFLNFREAVGRLTRNLSKGQPLRSPDGGDNGVRLLDVNGDGFMDVVIGNEQVTVTRVWDANAHAWKETETPVRIVSSTDTGGSRGERVQFGITRKEGAATMLAQGEMTGAWSFENGKWKAMPMLLKGLEAVTTLKSSKDSGIRLRDFDRDGVCELLASNASTNAIYRWSEGSQRWSPANFALPDGVALLNDRGEDNGLRFVDLNEDGFDDVLLSNEQRYAIHLWTKEAKPQLGWTAGWSQPVRAGERKGKAEEPPAIVRDGNNRNNGAWFRDSHLVVQNEDTAKLEAVVDRRSFKQLIAFDVPPPKSPEESRAAIRVRPGFKVELVASEPLVVDPIAFEWDARGRLWVVEMRDYPLGMDGQGKPGGVVKVLEDTDGDGRYDKATPFLEGLAFPTGVMPWRKGVLVCAAPEIFYAEDTDGDGRADVRRTLFTGFKPGNQQHRLNGFEWGLDGWIYGANGDSGGTVKSIVTGAEVSISGRDFRFRPDTGEFEAEAGATQYGRRRDDWGNWFGNNNPTWLWQYTLTDRYLRRNPKLAVKSTRKVLANYDEPTRVFAISAQPTRFNQPQSLGHVTSACSPAPYRDELFGPEFAGNVFISEPVHNVVHREILSPDGAIFSSGRANDEQDREFLASSDVWFRPTMLKTGPDGALYIADMYRFVLEHPEWIAPETQSRLDLRAGDDTGRIYRVVPVDKPLRAIPDLSKLDTAGLVAALDSPNGWQRDAAQRLLVERVDQTGVAALEKLVIEAKNAKVRVQALSTLEVLNAARAEVVSVALRDADANVRVNALRVSERLAGKSEALLGAVLALENDAAPNVRRQLAFSLGEWKSPLAQAALARLADREGRDPQMRVAILSSVGADNTLMVALREEPGKGAASGMQQAPKITYSSPDRAKVIASFAGLANLRPDPAHGREVFRQVCSACHRVKAEGRELGPDLGMVAGKPDDWLLTAIFDPNQAVEARYRAQQVTMKEGPELLGLLAGETTNNITLRTPDGNEQAILRSDIREIKSLNRSLMPEGLESVLKPQDVADLIGFLRQP